MAPLVIFWSVTMQLQDGKGKKFQFLECGRITKFGLTVLSQTSGSTVCEITSTCKTRDLDPRDHAEQLGG